MRIVTQKIKKIYNIVIGFIAIPIDYIIWNLMFSHEYDHVSWKQCWEDYKRIAGVAQ